MILLFVVNVPEFFLSHRLPLAIGARNAGFTVHIATAPGMACQRIAELGFEHHLLPISRSGRNPLAELRTLWGLYRLMRKIRPELVHLVTIKPVLYGGLMARLSGVPAMVAAISGLGTVFVDRNQTCSWVRRGVEWLYKLALGHPNAKVIFQNPDDRASLIGMGAVCKEKTALIRGSGISLAAYPMRPEPEGVPVITFAARLLEDKGVREFVEVARVLKERGVVARFCLAGSPDPGNLTSITEKELSDWSKEGVVEVLGYRSDIPDLYAKSNIVVLPSYREGLPKALIEAAACGRAVVTTDVPGCRDAIEPEATGLLVPVRDALALADAIQSLIEDQDRRKQMGASGRVLAEREFAIEKVLDAHLVIYRELTNGTNK
ncbi:glycosyltransferase family 4 protein [Azospira sp. I09]|uniref:glycosyltransferase family 4 protein n=1 Tax=Azospira sp. I09 TaxID=1765049 RepID=UPI001260BCAC|nr:glycosyltransferase family 4 protein [Azospira sp. I09]